MSKGKKFNAAERHFIKKQEAYEKELKDLRAVTEQCRREADQAKMLLREIQKENARLVEERDAALALQGISYEEFKEKLAAEKKSADAMSLLKGLLGGLHYA